MQIILSPTHLTAIEAQGERSYPNEGAGLLLGHLNGDSFIVEDVVTLDNDWEEGEQGNRFRLNEQDYLKATLEAASQELDVVGVFHSHPDHPAEPSQWDLAWATWPNFSYLITRVNDGKASTTRAWQLREDRSAFVEDDIQIKDNA